MLWFHKFGPADFDHFLQFQLDCGDFSDESHCGRNTKCESDQFECENGLCIQHQWICDGQYHTRTK